MLFQQALNLVRTHGSLLTSGGAGRVEPGLQF